MGVGVCMSHQSWSALHTNVNSRERKTQHLGQSPEAMFSIFPPALHVEIDPCSPQGQAFWGHWSRAMLCVPLAEQKTRVKGNGANGSRASICLPRPPASDTELLALVQVGRGKHRPELRMEGITVVRSHTSSKDRPWMHLSVHTRTPLEVPMDSWGHRRQQAQSCVTRPLPRKGSFLGELPRWRLASSTGSLLS